MHQVSFYTRLLLAVFFVIPLIVLVGMTTIHEIFESAALTALVVCSGVAAVLVQVVIRWHAFQEMQMRDLNWYRRHFPRQIRGRHVLCAKCGAEDIYLRTLPPPTHMREHYCGKCGQVLYYSPERT